MDDKRMLMNFGVIHRRFLSMIDAVLEDTNLSFYDGMCLVNIFDMEGLNLEQMAQVLFADRSIISRSVKRLEELGYIETRRCKWDKRSKELYITEKGKAMAIDIAQKNNEQVFQLFSACSPEEQRAFCNTLEKIVQSAASENT